MSHRRTHLWISLVVGVVVWGAYFAHFLTRMQNGTPGVLMIYFLAALAVTVLAELVATGLIAWLFRRRARILDDGPTLEAALKASHVALMTVIVLALVAAGALVIAAGFGWEPDFGSPRTAFARMATVAANALLAMVVIAELVRAAFTLALMPRR